MNGKLYNFFIAFCTVLLCSPAFAWERASEEAVVRGSMAGVVKVTVRGHYKGSSDVQWSRGSGFLVSKYGSVITAYHVVPDELLDQEATAQFVQITNQGDRLSDPIKLSPVDRDAGLDLAIMHLEKVPTGGRPLPLLSRLPRKGERMNALGFPDGKDSAAPSPLVFDTQTSPHRFQYQGIVNHGDSGGPIINRDGYVVGVVHAEETQAGAVNLSGINFGVPVSALKAPAEVSESVAPVYFAMPLADSRGGDQWTVDQIDQAKREYFESRSNDYCGALVSDAMVVTKEDNQGGFGVNPKQGTLLAESEFNESFVLAKELSLMSTGGYSIYAKSDVFTVPRYDFSYILFRIPVKTKNEESDRLIPFFIRLAKDDVEIGKYLPRYFNELDYKPFNVNSSLATCSANHKLPLALFITFCEDFMKRIMYDYYSTDNACLAGRSTRQ